VSADRHFLALFTPLDHYFFTTHSFHNLKSVQGESDEGVA